MPLSGRLQYPRTGLSSSSSLRRHRMVKGHDTRRPSMAGGGCPSARRLMDGIGVAASAMGLFLSAVGAPAGAATSSSVAQAKKHLLVLSDLPKGWSVEKGTGGSGGSAGLPGGS